MSEATLIHQLRVARTELVAYRDKLLKDLADLRSALDAVTKERDEALKLITDSTRAYMQVYKTTCIHHTDAERMEFRCPVCLGKQLAAANADRQRLDWLEANLRGDEILLKPHGAIVPRDGSWADLRQAIDAAIAHTAALANPTPASTAEEGRV